MEQEGVRRTHQRVEQADLSLMVVDLTQLPSEPQLVPVFLSGHLKSILEHSSHRQDCILILNKSDLISAEHKRSMEAALKEAADVPPACFFVMSQQRWPSGSPDSISEETKDTMWRPTDRQPESDSDPTPESPAEDRGSFTSVLSVQGCGPGAGGRRSSVRPLQPGQDHW